MKTVDACGMSCPEPLLMLKNALKDDSEVTLLVDNQNALDNCSGYAKKNGFSVRVTDAKGIHHIHIAAKQ